MMLLPSKNTLTTGKQPEPDVTEHEDADHDTSFIEDLAAEMVQSEGNFI